MFVLGISTTAGSADDDQQRPQHDGADKEAGEQGLRLVDFVLQLLRIGTVDSSRLGECGDQDVRCLQIHAHCAYLDNIEKRNVILFLCPIFRLGNILQVFFFQNRAHLHNFS